jgi:hypothetical protein
MCEREGRMKAIEFDGFLHIDCAGDWIASNHIPKFFFVECVKYRRFWVDLGGAFPS